MHFMTFHRRKGRIGYLSREERTVWVRSKLLCQKGEETKGLILERRVEVNDKQRCCEA